MPKILAPNREYCGVSAGVTFADGIGETENEHLLKWFEDKGYYIERPDKETETEPGEETEKEKTPKTRRTQKAAEAG